jgi:O-antigen/teichoic acid export membrane protein
MGIRNSLFFSFSSGYAKLGLQFVASLFIARLLTPREFGVFSIAMGLIFLADTLRNFGIAGYVIQEKELTPSRLNTAAGLNILTSFIMAAVIAGLASPAATFYGEEGVRDVMWLLAFNFLLLPIGATSMAYMRRELMFKKVAIVQVANAATGSIAAVILAYAGFSFMSLAMSNVLATVVTMTMIWRLKPGQLKIRPALSEWRRVLGFGVLATAESSFFELGNRLPGLMIGRLINLEAVAFFDRAASVIELFKRLVLNSIMTVAMPHFATQVRKNENVAHSYLQAIQHLSVVGWPFFLLLSLVSPQLIPILYGDQWHDAAPLAQILCLGELALVPFYLLGQVIIAQGRMGFQSLRTLFGVILKVMVIYFLAPSGLHAVVVGFAISSVVIAIITIPIAVNVLACPAGDFIRALYPSLKVSLFNGLIVLTMAWMINGLDWHPALHLLVIVFACATSWLLGLWLFKHPTLPELLNVQQVLMKKLRKSRV